MGYIGKESLKKKRVDILICIIDSMQGDTRDMDLIPGSGRSPGGGNGNPLQYSCLQYPMDRGAWQNQISP